MTKARIDKDGWLELLRGERGWKSQHCPEQQTTEDDDPHCGDWCPRFVVHETCVRLCCTRDVF